jgi:hypothetical protein
MALPAMQKGSFEGVEPDTHGGISKQPIDLDGGCAVVEMSRGTDCYGR